MDHDNEHPDAELIALGVRLAEAQAEEARVQAHATMDRAGEDACINASLVSARLVRDIAGIRAVTLPGLQVKVDAYLWANDGNLPEVASSTADRAVLRSLLQDLLEMRAPVVH